MWRFSGPRPHQPRWPRRRAPGRPPTRTRNASGCRRSAPATGPRRRRRPPATARHPAPRRPRRRRRPGPEPGSGLPPATAGGPSSRGQRVHGAELHGHPGLGRGPVETGVLVHRLVFRRLLICRVDDQAELGQRRAGRWRRRRRGHLGECRRRPEERHNEYDSLSHGKPPPVPAGTHWLTD